jgi:hypothetical protein
MGYSMCAERRRNLLDARNDIEVAESAIQAVEAGLGIRGNKYRNKLIDPSRIRRGEAHPQFPFAGGEFHAVNVDRQLAQISDIDGTAVLTPCQLLLSRVARPVQLPRLSGALT